MTRLWTGVLLLWTACGVRAPGPHDNEQGKVTYWEVLSSEARTSQCTDSGDWADVVEGPTFTGGSFLMYRVEAGGQTATGQSCDTLASNSCADSDEVWQIDGHILRFQAEPVPLDSAGDCVIDLLAAWTLVDEGETALLQVQIQFEYATVGTACDAIETTLVEESANGFGLANCTVTVDADVGLAAVR